MRVLLTVIKTNWIAFTLVTLAAITVLSIWPLDEFPPVPGNDKTHHFIAYAALMFPAALSKPKRCLLIAVLFVAYSGSIELVQPYVNRYAEWADMIANTTGIVFGIILAKLMNCFFPISINRPR
ncbi:MAG: VanZ family protein [Candidatus Competibacteraceae bacterium]|nr:VanZ family protein [Candidatus Competibacteraceae bacterium]